MNTIPTDVEKKLELDTMVERYNELNGEIAQLGVNCINSLSAELRKEVIIGLYATLEL